MGQQGELFEKREETSSQIWFVFGAFIGLMFGIAGGFACRLIPNFSEIGLLLLALLLGIMSGLVLGAVTLHTAIVGGLIAFCLGLGLSLASTLGFWFGFCFALGIMLGVSLGYGLRCMYYREKLDGKKL